MDGTICTPQDLERAKSSSSLHCLTRGESIGLTLLVVTGATSVFAVLLVFLLVIRNVIREAQRGSGKQLIRQPMDLYMLSLLSADLLHALGSVMNIKWIGEGKSEIGSYCAAQGVINQVGPVAVALNTLAIAFVTFIAVWWNKGVPTGQRVKFHLNVACAIVAALWLLVAILVAVPAGIYSKSSDLYWVPTPLWCTIGKDYEDERLWAKYLWLWLAFLVLVVLYIPLAFWARGNITISTKTWWKFSIHKRGSNQNEEGGPGRHIFFGMIGYPLSNAILVVPLSVVRWIENTGPNDITSTDTLAAAIIFSFSGVTNVLLLLYIRPNLLLFGRDTNHCEHCMGLLMPQVDPVEMQPVEGNAAEWRHPFADGYEHSGRAQQGQDIP